MKEEKKTQNTAMPQVPAIAVKLDETVAVVLGNSTANRFERAYLLSDAIGKLREQLTDQYMQPIMKLQGNRLGFKTDKDKDGGYGMEIVRNCLIEAVLMGVQPCGNQFNIIAGNTYITKEGYGYLLANLSGLNYEISQALPRIKYDPQTQQYSAAVVSHIKWTYNGVSGTKEIDSPVNVNKGMGADGVLGKGTRKARKWLFEYLTGSETPDGEVEGTATVVSSRPLSEVDNADKEEERRVLVLLDACTTIEDVQLLQAANPHIDVMLFDARKDEIKNGSK